MERIFYKKSTATIFVAAILILVLLLCALLITLVQMSALDTRLKQLRTLLDAAMLDEQNMQAFLEYKSKNEYIIKWAEEHGYLKEDDIKWLEENA